MLVEWYGGPWDGETMEAPDDSVAMDVDIARNLPDTTMHPSIRTVRIPIETSSKGTRFVRYPLRTGQ